MTNRQKAYVIIEPLLLVVVFSIAIAFMVQYSLLARQSNESQLSNLSQNKQVLRAYFVKYGVFPRALDSNNCPIIPEKDLSYCLDGPANTKLVYQQAGDSTQDYTLYAESTNKVYLVSNTLEPIQTALTSACPNGFIPVPGSPTYGTSDFCAMKYEAKCASRSAPMLGLERPRNRDMTYENNNKAAECIAHNDRVITSSASGAPMALLTYDTAIEYSKNTCKGCQLMSESQWMTIAENVSSVASNWTTGRVGSGGIYAGHTDKVPNTALTASVSDADGYFGTQNDPGSNQRRTLTLTNGQVIWDFIGNVWEWTQPEELQTELQIMTEAKKQTLPWYSLYSIGTIAPDILPTGVGVEGGFIKKKKPTSAQIFNNVTYPDTKGYVRGGFWGTADCKGMLSKYVNNSPPGYYSGIGFRVARY